MAQGEVFEVNTLIIRDPVSGLLTKGALWSELSRHLLNQPIPVESQKHLVSRWSSDLEILLKVCFSGSLPIDLRIVVDEGHILTLLFTESGGWHLG